MNKFLHSLTGLVLLLIPLVWGGFLVYANLLNNGMRDRVFSFVQGMPLVGAAVGVALILILLVYLATFGPPKPRARFIAFESDNGSVSISVDAVTEFIRKLGDEFGAIVSMEPRISSEKTLISIHLDVKIQAGSRIPELSQTLQNRVRESIRDGLGIVEVREIKVKVKEIVGAPLPAQTV